MSEYGAKLLSSNSNIINLWGKKDCKDISDIISHNGVDIVIDSTHPYAKEVSQNIITACKDSNKKLLRYEREYSFKNTDGIHFDSMDSVLHYLKNHNGNVLFTTGVNDVPKICKVLDLERIFLRVLPVESSVNRVKEFKIPESHVITTNPPFTTQDNIKHIQKFNITYVVTKDSGTEGFCQEKLDACKKTNKTLLIIDRPVIEYNNIFYIQEDVIRAILRDET